MKKILFNERTSQKRAAIIEDDKLVELYMEDEAEESVVGNIYRGRVVKVIPGMQAAFVDIGLKKNGFLQKDQVLSYKKLQPSQREKAQLSSLLTEGQEVIVQVTKDSFGEKGPRLTTLIELPGRFVVYMPNDRHIAVSKKLEESAREEWRSFGVSVCNEQEGLIFRTSCQGQAKETVHNEIKALQKRWTEMVTIKPKRKPPYPIYYGANVNERLMRDLLPEQTVEIIVDDGDVFRQIKEELSIFPATAITVTYHSGKEDLFQLYGIDQEIERSLQPQLWLENGASLTIDQTEALTVIDVNTAKFIGKQNAQETILKTNELAAQEIARQLRLRNIGGMVLIDFINMKQDKHRELVKRKLVESLKVDRHYTQVLGFTSLGLLEMTRKKDRKSLSEQLMMPCPTCQQTGKVYSNEEICFRIERALWEYKGMDAEAILIETSASVIELFNHQGHSKRLEEVVGFSIYFQALDTDNQIFEIRHIGEKAEIEKRISKQ